MQPAAEFAQDPVSIGKTERQIDLAEAIDVGLQNAERLTKPSAVLDHFEQMFGEQRFIGQICQRVVAGEAMKGFLRPALRIPCTVSRNSDCKVVGGLRQQRDLFVDQRIGLGSQDCKSANDDSVDAQWTKNAATTTRQLCELFAERWIRIKSRNGDCVPGTHGLRKRAFVAQREKHAAMR